MPPLDDLCSRASLKTQSGSFPAEHCTYYLLAPRNDAKSLKVRNHATEILPRQVFTTDGGAAASSTDQTTSEGDEAGIEHSPRSGELPISWSLT